MKRDYNTQIKQVRAGWIGAFGNMKTAVRDVFTDLRSSIDRLEADSGRALTLSPVTTGRGGVDLTGIHEDIDKLQDRINEYNRKWLI